MMPNESAHNYQADKDFLQNEWGNRSCPCHYVTPCRATCTCANPVMSGGCDRCCSYGSLEQRKAQAERLVEILTCGRIFVSGMEVEAKKHGLTAEDLLK